MSVLCLRASNHLARVGDDKVKSYSWGKRGINVLMKSTIFGYIALYDVWDKNQHITWRIIPNVLNGFDLKA